MSNDDFRSTRGMSDAQVERRQMESRKVTRVTEQGPVVCRFPLALLPIKWRWRSGNRRTGLTT